MEGILIVSKDINAHENFICVLPTVLSMVQSLIPVQRPGRWLSPENPFFLQHFMSAGLKTQALHAGRLSQRLAQSSAPVATGESMSLPPTMFTSFFLQPAKTMLPLSFYKLMVKISNKLLPAKLCPLCSLITCKAFILVTTKFMADALSAY